jgi:hypothetical protein
VRYLTHVIWGPGCRVPGAGWLWSR